MQRASSERRDQMRALMYFSEVPKLSVLMSAVRLGSSRLPHERADAPFLMPSSRVSPQHCAKGKRSGSRSAVNSKQKKIDRPVAEGEQVRCVEPEDAALKGRAAKPLCAERCMCERRNELLAPRRSCPSRRSRT